MIDVLRANRRRSEKPKTFFILILICFLLSACHFRVNDLKVKSGYDNKEFLVATSKKFTDGLLEELNGKIKTQELYPEKSNEGYILVLNGTLDLITTMIVQLCYQNEIKDITSLLPARTEENSSMLDQIINGLSEDTEIIYYDDNMLNKWSIGSFPAIYYIKDGIVEYKKANIRFQDWPEINEIMSSKKHIGITKSSFIEGEKFPILSLFDETDHEIELNTNGKQCYLFLSPTCSICSDIIPWIKQSDWKVKPTIIIDDSSYYSDSIENFKDSFPQVIVDEELLTQMQQWDLGMREKVKAYIELLGDDFTVLKDSLGDLKKNFVEIGYPFMVITDENGCLKHARVITLVNPEGKNLFEGYENPLDLAK